MDTDESKLSPPEMRGGTAKECKLEMELEQIQNCGILRWRRSVIAVDIAVVVMLMLVLWIFLMLLLRYVAAEICCC
jgi:hypothetical protein